MLFQRRASFSWRIQRQRRRHFRRHLRPQANRISLASRMHRIRQQYDVGLRRRIDPDRCSRKSRVPKRSDGQQIAAIRRKRRIDVPPKPAQHRRRGGCSGCVIFATAMLTKSPAAVQQRLRKFRQIVRRRKQSRMPRHAAHAPRRRIMHHAAQHVFVLVILRGRNFRAATPPGGTNRVCIIFSGAKICSRRVSVQRLA